MIDGSYEKARNYCRNPTNDPDGPYCFVAVVDRHDGTVVEKRPCHVRKCRNTSEFQLTAAVVFRVSTLIPVGQTFAAIIIMTVLIDQPNGRNRF